MHISSKFLSLVLVILWFCTGLAVKTDLFYTLGIISSLATLFSCYSQKSPFFVASAMSAGAGAISLLMFMHAADDPFLLVVGIPTAGFMLIMAYGISMIGED